MAKKIKFPLDMGNDIKVRTIDELKEHYDAEKVMSYFLDGQLLMWLNDRYYDEEAEQVLALSDNDDSADISAELARIFGIELTDEIDVEAVKYRNEKLSKLREITSDDEILSNVDKVAFSQEELGDLLDEGYDVIYLCGDVFRIPLRENGKTYIGINNPLIDVSSSKEFSFNDYNISIKNCEYTDKTLEMLFDANKLVDDGLKYLEDNDYLNALTCFKKAAESGNHEGEFQYAKMYANGTGVESDRNFARQWYIKAASDGSAKACNNLGIMYDSEKDFVTARSYFEKGALLGESGMAFYNFGKLYLNENYGEKNPILAEKWLSKAAESNVRIAFMPLIQLYLNDEYEIYDVKKAEHWLMKFAEMAEDEFDLEEIGDMYLNDSTELFDPVTALKYFEAALERVQEEDPDLWTKRAKCLYKMGDVDAALYEFEQAIYSEEHIEDAMDELISHYRKMHDDQKVTELCIYYVENYVPTNGDYIKTAADFYYDIEDMDTAIHWYEDAADLWGNEAACEKLGDIYTIELNMRDFDKARKYYEKALKLYEIDGISKSDPIYQHIQTKLDMVRK